MRFIVSLLLSYVLSLSSAYAQSALQLIDNNEVLRLSDHLTYLFEDGAPLTVEQARSKVDQFTYPQANNPNYGYQENGLWLYERFINLTDKKDWVIDIGYSQLEHADFYLFADGQLIAQSEQGKSTLNHTQRFPTLIAELPFAVNLELFVRVQSRTSSLIVPMDIQPQKQHARQVLLDTLLWGVFYGGLMILAVYNLVLYFSVRETSLIAYCGYIFTVIVWQFVWGGHLLQVFPSLFSLWLESHSDLIYVLIGIGSGIFTLTFLDAKKYAPKSRNYVIAFLGVLSLLGITSALELIPVLWQLSLVYLVSLAAMTSFVIAGYESYFNQFRPARYFIFAWSILYGCAVIGMLSLSTILPSNFITTYCFQFGVFVEAGLFSLALMDKNRNKLEREITQATDDLRNNMVLVEEQNARLDIARKDAIDASHVKSQFLANMSHEIRTPLNAILGFSRELADSPLIRDRDTCQDTKEQVKMINYAASNLLDVVNDVLDFSKIEAGKLQLANKVFDLNQLLEDIVRVMSQSAQSQGLEFLFDSVPLPDKMLGDDFRIKQVLNNLLSNAIKFTPSGHVSLKVRTQVMGDTTLNITFSIEDTGIGISQEESKKLFSAFSQLDDSLNRAYQGTGLGLVICQQLVKLMRGKLHYESEKGQGTRFDVSLTLHPITEKLGLIEDVAWQHKTVAVFDPLPNSRRALVATLKSLHAHVFSFDSGMGLGEQTTEFDYLIVTLPQTYVGMQRDSAISSFAQINAKQVVLGYSGDDPSLHAPELTQLAAHKLRLPLTASRLTTISRPTPVQAAQSSLQESMQSLPAAKVLAVDDMPMNLRLLSTWLKDSKVELVCAESGREAVNLCEQYDYDLILMDVQMPEVDGLQATKLIRKTSLNMGTPVIAVTAHAFKEEQEMLLSSGMDDYLAKPIDVPELARLIRLWCADTAEHEPVSLETLDWALAMRKANQDEVAARGYLRDFINELNEVSAAIEQAWQQNNQAQLQYHVHRLNGASSYTGVPKLKSLCDELEGAIKLRLSSRMEAQLPLLLEEINQVQSAAKAYL